jgi:hypothetical protein
MGEKINIIQKDCDISAANNRSLPLNSYIISYSDNKTVKYDIVQGSKVTIFDHYYDEYRNLISMKWTNGKVNPKMYNNQDQKKSKK